MNRTTKVYLALNELCEAVSVNEIEAGFSGFDTDEISAKADIDRSNTSRALNELFLEEKVVKVKGRPVYYFTTERLKTLFPSLKGFHTYTLDSLKPKKQEEIEEPQNALRTFSDFIGNKKSLEMAIKQAKAGIIYPPNGLNTLLTGPSGSGKSSFAEAMYSFALKNKCINKNASFMVFNCAEYADNPQLLLSQLFGNVKGAYTGADADKEGIVARANGGVLFLDEVHRLPPQGQELLFTLIDKGIYHKLGDSVNSHKVNIRLICATTENIESNLLKTFTRRIPLIIQLPSLYERSLKERFQLVKDFFNSERF